MASFNGSDKNDHLIGSSANDNLNGKSGNDTLEGGLVTIT